MFPILSTPDFRPVAGAVPAGFPSPATEALGDKISIDQYLVGRPTQTVLVTVKGDSMVDAGIHSGDILVVEKRGAARPGQIVVAIVDNEFTVKELVRDGEGLALRPANAAYPTIRPKNDLELFGVVVGVFRKYPW